MAKKPAPSSTHNPSWWRTFIVIVLSAVGVISLLGYMFVHWTERQLLTTDNYVELVAPLPQNQEVSSALATYTVDKLFDARDIQSRIAEALPDRAAFLAPTLTERLDARLTSGTAKLIQSDQFTSIWTDANRKAHETLMTAARAPARTKPTITKPDFNLDLSAVREKINDRFGTDIQPLIDRPDGSLSDKKLDIDANIGVKFSKFKDFVKAMDKLNSTLWLVGIAGILGALAVSWHRRRLIMVLSIVILVIALLQLIGVNAVRPVVLNHIENQSFKPAVGVVYDELTANFRDSATTVAIVSAVIFVLTLVTKPALLGRSKLISGQWTGFKGTSVYRLTCDARALLRRYFWGLAGGIVLLGLALGAFVFSLDWVGVIRLALAMVISIELVSLAALRPGPNSKRQPM